MSSRTLNPWGSSWRAKTDADAKKAASSTTVAAAPVATSPASTPASSSAAATAAPPPAASASLLPTTPATPAPAPTSVPAAGTPKQAGEYYGNTTEVWAGGDVTRRACEIQQSGAKGACKRWGFPWGMTTPATPAPAADTPSNAPTAPTSQTDAPNPSTGGGGVVFLPADNSWAGLQPTPGVGADLWLSDVSQEGEAGGFSERPVGPAGEPTAEAPSRVPLVLAAVAAFVLLRGKKRRARR